MMATFYRAAIFAIEADNESAADQTWIDNGPECGDRVMLADYWPVAEYVAGSAQVARSVCRCLALSFGNPVILAGG